MNFFAPMAWVFAATIPVVILFYLLKKRRSRSVVSSTLLWKRYLTEHRANSPFQRLRSNWLLVLQVLMLLLLITALSRPYFFGELSNSRLQVVIMDASASMKAKDTSPSRFETARRSALELVDGLRDKDQMIVIIAGVNTEVKQSPTQNKSVLRRVINDLKPTDGPTRLLDALKLADTLTKDVNSPEIHVFSDGAADDLGEMEKSGIQVSYHRVGHRSDNVGIIGIESRLNPEDTTKRNVFVTLSNSSSNHVSSTLELTLDGRLLDVKPIEIPSRSNASALFELVQESTGVLKAKWMREDDLESDNSAVVISSLPQPIRVWIVTPGNAFLVKAIRSLPHVRIVNVSSDDSNLKSLECDVVILDRFVPIQWPDRPVFAFRSSGSDWFPATADTDECEVVDWKSTHPILRDVNLETLEIIKTVAVKEPAWATSIVESRKHSLIFAGENRGNRVVWVGFDLHHSTWPLRVSFPIFTANVVEWLGSSKRSEQGGSVRTGESVRLEIPSGANNLEIQNPGGERAKLRNVESAREVVVGNLDLVGVYQVVHDGVVTTNRFAVNVANAKESDLLPRVDLSLGKHAKARESVLNRANLDTWKWLATMGLVVLCWEWWYFHRRTV